MGNSKLHIILGGAIIALAVLVAAIAHAEPTMDDIYRTARAGDLTDADSMIRGVLQNHPNSAKAHYVYAQILAQEGYKNQARDELSTAERIMPGLSFAKPQAVQELEHKLNLPSNRPTPREGNAPMASSSGHVLLWVLLFLSVIGLFIFFLWWINDDNRRWHSIYQSQPRPDDCSPSPSASSRVCERGSRGCTVQHGYVGPDPIVHEHTTVIHDGGSSGGFVEGAIIGSMMRGGGNETIINNNPTPAAEPAPSQEPAQQASPDLGGKDFGVDQGDPSGKDSWSNAPSPDPEPQQAAPDPSWDNPSPDPAPDPDPTSGGGWNDPSSGGADSGSGGGGSWDN
jgi:uncharacterized protein